MSIFSRYLSRLFAGQFLLVLLSASALLQLFDVMSNAEDIGRDYGTGVLAILRYSGLRLPELMTFLVPFCVLIAALMALGRLHRYSELVALQAVGVPHFKILAMFLPSLSFLVVLHFVASDRLVPRTTASLAAWETSRLDLDDPEEAEETRLWIREGEDVISIGHILDQGQSLAHVAIFTRDDQGNLLGQLSAERAIHADGAWRLEQIKDLSLQPNAGRGTVTTARRSWHTRLTPELLLDLAAPADAMSITRLSALINRPEIGSRPTHVYQVWRHKAFASPMASFFMVMLAAASVRSLQRQGMGTRNALIGFGGAFCYFIVDGVLLAMGEAGTAPPAIAAWVPLAVLAAVSVAVLRWVSRPRGRWLGKTRSAPSVPADVLPVDI